MQRKSKTISYINLSFLILGILIVFYSGWNLLINKIYVPYFLLLTGSILLTAMFAALTVARHQGRTALLWTILALFNSLLFIYLYFSPNHLKELYPLSIWIFLAIVISSIQQVLDRMKKRYHSLMRIFNFGLIITLIPIYLLKTDAPVVWSIFSWLTLIIMLVNLTLFLLPTSREHQSR